MRKFSVRPTLTLRGRKFKGLRGWSGKPTHPPLTDVPVAAYVLAAVFDIIAVLGRHETWGWIRAPAARCVRRPAKTGSQTPSRPGTSSTADKLSGRRELRAAAMDPRPQLRILPRGDKRRRAGTRVVLARNDNPNLLAISDRAFERGLSDRARAGLTGGAVPCPRRRGCGHVGNRASNGS